MSWYGVTGLFLDEVSDRRAHLGHYRALVGSLRASGATTIILNPGTVSARPYLDLGDVVVTFEDDAAAYARARFPAWLRRADPARIAHLVHTAAPDEAAAMMELAGQRRAGSAYVTEDGGDNPWDTLSPHWCG